MFLSLSCVMIIHFSGLSSFEILCKFKVYEGLPRWLSGRRILLPMQEMQKTRIQSLGQEDSLDEEIATHSILLPGKFYGQRGLAAYCPQSCKEPDKPEHACR